MTSKIPPIHPILDEDYIKGFGVTQNKLALAIGVPPRRINEIVHGKDHRRHGTAAWSVLRRGVPVWLQTHHDLETDRIQDQVDAIRPLQTA